MSPILRHFSQVNGENVKKTQEIGAFLDYAPKKPEKSGLFCTLKRNRAARKYRRGPIYRDFMRS